jgi:hypothetical protein
MRSQFLAALQRCTSSHERKDTLTLPTGTAKIDEVRKVIHALKRCNEQKE